MHEIAQAIEEAPGVGAVIVSNSLVTPNGGLSGLPLRGIALGMTARLYQRWGKSLPIIGVGGILTPRDAWDRIGAGASLIQIFSGFVFRGPALIGEILGHIEAQMEKEGFANLEEAVGSRAHRYAR